MNRLMHTQAALLAETHHLREELLDAITDADLGFTPGGSNPTLAALLLKQGDCQQVYANAFASFRMDWTLEQSKPTASVAGLRDWFATLDATLVASLEALSDADLERPIDRGGWSVPVETNFHIYREAVLIYAARTSVYLRALGKPLPQQTQVWIG